MRARSLRPTLVVVSLIGLVLGLGAPAYADHPPDNDDFDDAVVVEALPFEHEVDTSHATTANDDPDCVGRGPTVWYRFTATEDMRVEANTFGSDYDTTLSVYSGTRGDLTQIACNDDAGGTLQSRVRFDVEAGETFHLMVGAFASGPGGDLVFRMLEAPPAPPPLELEISIDPVGTVVPSKGVATVSGTLTCSRPAFVEVFGDLQQRAGRVIIRGFFFDFVECDGTVPWTATVIGENGLFVGGRATVDVFAFSFDDDDDFEDGFVSASAQIRLRGTRPN